MYLNKLALETLHQLQYYTYQAYYEVVLILMNEGDFNTTQVKNIIVTYYISKIWVASQMRGQS